MIKREWCIVPPDEKSWQTMPVGHVTMPGKGETKSNSIIFWNKESINWHFWQVLSFWLEIFVLQPKNKKITGPWCQQINPHVSIDEGHKPGLFTLTVFYCIISHIIPLGIQPWEFSTLAMQSVGPSKTGFTRICRQNRVPESLHISRASFRSLLQLFSKWTETRSLKAVVKFIAKIRGWK